MNKPQFITFTGIDERTDLIKVIELSNKYPVEWGILFSKNNTGKSKRYPSLEYIIRFFNIKNLKLSAHICGSYSNQILEKEESIDISDFLSDYFDRVQINIADGESDVRSQIFPERADKFAKTIRAKKAIIQCLSDFPESTIVDWLYDTSGGAGIENNNWDNGAENTNAFCGYAGGISPDNITRVLNKINKIHPKDKPYWIDMESMVRTDEWLDLDKCEYILDKVYG